MKVYPNLTLIHGQKHSLNNPGRGDSAKGVKSAGESAEKEGGFRDVVEVVSIENRRALSQALPLDMGTAEQILGKVKQDLESMTKSGLKRLHRLEGLVHVYSG